MLTDFLEETPEDLAVAAERSRGEILVLFAGYFYQDQYMLLLQLCQIPSLPHKCFSVPTVVGVLGDVESFSGFLRVDPEEDSQLFFWLVLKEKNPETG